MSRSAVDSSSASPFELVPDPVLQNILQRLDLPDLLGNKAPLGSCGTLLLL
jgi:hypothetical protein